MGSLLQGDFNKFILSSDQFGVPAGLENRNIDTLYKRKNESGWDGQFYYYISNDILGTADTVEHIDAPSYRYQRIGHPLTASIVSSALFQEWVSPLVFYSSSLAVILYAVFCFSKYLIKNRASPVYAIFWGASYGT
jgi:hypothetical protein